MRPTPTDLKLLCLAADGRRYGVTPTLAPNPEAAIATVEKAISKGQQYEVVDFDVHLDDVSKNWLGNADLLE